MTRRRWTTRVLFSFAASVGLLMMLAGAIWLASDRQEQVGEPSSNQASVRSQRAGDPDPAADTRTDSSRLISCDRCESLRNDLRADKLTMTVQRLIDYEQALLGDQAHLAHIEELLGSDLPRRSQALVFLMWLPWRDRTEVRSAAESFAAAFQRSPDVRFIAGLLWELSSVTAEGLKNEDTWGRRLRWGDRALWFSTSVAEFDLALAEFDGNLLVCPAAEVGDHPNAIARTEKPRASRDNELPTRLTPAQCDLVDSWRDRIREHSVADALWYDLSISGIRDPRIARWVVEDLKQDEYANRHFRRLFYLQNVLKREGASPGDIAVIEGLCLRRTDMHTAEMCVRILADHKQGTGAQALRNIVEKHPNAAVRAEAAAALR
jgi:hypothetical protein